MDSFHFVLEKLFEWQQEYKKLETELQTTKEKLAVSKQNEARLSEELEFVKLQALGFEDDFLQERQQKEGLANQLYELKNSTRVAPTCTDNQMDCDTSDGTFAGTTDLACPKCGLQYSSSDHDLFLEHLDEC